MKGSFNIVKKRILVLFLIFFSWLPGVLGQKSPFRFLQKNGHYSVGLKVVNQYDDSRSWPVRKTSSQSDLLRSNRPLQILVWYPSLTDNRPSMTVSDYVQLADREIRFDSDDAQENKWRSRLKMAFAEKLRAVKNAIAINGRYPILIYAPSDSGVSWENADLCEYLASQGYIVLASPSMGSSTRDMTDDLEGIRAQAQDISYLITYGASLVNADSSKVAVLSWSYGGISSLFAAAHDSRIDGLVSLDGSLRYYPGLVQKGGIHPEKMTIPLMFFTQGDLSLEALAQDDAPYEDRIGPNVLNKWVNGDFFCVHMLGMSHPEFSSMSQRRKTAEKYREDQIADYNREDTNTGYALVALYTLNFLNRYLKNEALAKTFLNRTPKQNEAPDHFISVSFRPAQTVSKSNK